MGRNVCHRAEPASRWTTRWRAHRVCAGAARSPDRLAAHDSSLDSDGHLLLARMDGVGGLATDQRQAPSYGSRLAGDLWVSQMATIGWRMPLIRSKTAHTIHPSQK